ncbi:transposase [Candidatus Kaiserbacteria bacterium]|nr:transposase [Candidatus Kaiserbacteria bacterium]
MELYHVLNRGTEKRDIFMDDRDRARFVHDLFEFNDTKPASNVAYSFKRNMDVGHPYIERERIVDLHAWCLMRNHYHLLISERMDGGTTTFMRKLNTGYTNYFNERYKRSGVLFQGKTKKVLIHSRAHFLHVIHYIHLNPLDYVSSAREWRNGRVADAATAKKRLEQYRWSSFLDYSGKKNFPSVLYPDFFRDAIGDVGKKTLEYLGKPRNALDDTLPSRFLE